MSLCLELIWAFRSEKGSFPLSVNVTSSAGSFDKCTKVDNNIRIGRRLTTFMAFIVTIHI